MTKQILGIVFISGGSSWATAELTDKVTLEVIASEPLKTPKDLGNIYLNFQKNIYVQ